MEQPQTLTFAEMKPAIAWVISTIESDYQKHLEQMPDNLRLRRNSYLRLREQGLLTPERITLEWDNIQKKQSRLPSSERKKITEIVTLAMRYVLVKKRDEAKAKADKDNAKQ